MAALVRYHWPGNVRELQHAIERAVILTRTPALSARQTMRLDIKVGTFSEVSAITRQVERRALLEFGRFGERVGSVSVRVSERRPAAGGRFHCGVAVRVRDEGTIGSLVIAQGQGDEVARAIEMAVGKAGNRTGGEIARIDEARRARREWITVPAPAHEVGR